MKVFLILILGFISLAHDNLTSESMPLLQLTSEVQKAHALVFAFQFDEAEELIRQNEALHQSNASISYVRCYSHLLQYLNSEDEAQYQKFTELWDPTFSLIEKSAKDNPLRNYLLADLYLQSAFANALKSNYFTAIIKFRSAYTTIVENQKLYPKFIPNQKVLGIMNIGLGSVPKSFEWVLNLLQMKGNINIGMRQLEAYFQLTQQQTQYRFLMPEALLLYSFSLSNYAGKIEKQHPLIQFYENQANAPLFQHQLNTFTKVSFYQHLKQNAKAISALDNIEALRSSAKYKLHFLSFMKGECLLFNNDIKAFDSFLDYVNRYPGFNYKRAARQKLAWIYMLHNEVNNYKIQMNKIMESGAEILDSDKQALKEAQKNMIPNSCLLSSRLFFDGGYYSKADSVLRKGYLEGKIKSQGEQLEYIYRMARISDEQNNELLAEIYYRQCINQGAGLNYYFPANAALLLGNMYEEKGDKVQARTLYKACLEMNYDEYQNGISQKAKAGLNRLQ